MHVFWAYIMVQYAGFGFIGAAYATNITYICIFVAFNFYATYSKNSEITQVWVSFNRDVFKDANIFL